MAGPLSGLKVVDFSRVLAGPLCSRTLVDLGADVTKVEPPIGDVTRYAAPTDGAMSGYYAQQNAGKRNISLDLNVPEAREVALRLCDGADIVVENFRAGALGSFGLDYNSVAARNPSVIYCSITGYGQEGPWRSRMAYAPTVQAEAGFTATSEAHYGERLSAFMTDSLSHADVYAGLQGVIAILAALHARDKTGEGQFIDVAMAATLLAVNEKAHLSLSDLDPRDEPPVLGATDCPFFVGPEGERIIVASSLIGSLTFRFFLTAMRRVDLAKDPRFATAGDRQANFDELHALVQRWIDGFPNKRALDAQFDEAKIAMGEVRTMKQIAASEWSEYWGATQTVSDRAGGEFTLPGRPWRFSRDRLDGLGMPAFQGEDNEEVCRELGFSEEELARLIKQRALLSNIPATREMPKSKPEAAT
ncbi:CaiB/BaiF CoA-transferase family protein [uncultured Erythrobacter sp.]|uniref:CaiB/BaiF CoA transferase family protein n=1 Tax=uncultured Erythrobacter sp. TaxID=263913 RepID=UPI00261883F6|nr:CaiB/BaiF CoA-transferase family protein [uncultured Erythrobacter sp.]